MGFRSGNRTRYIVLALAVLLCAGAAGASQESERLYSHGLVDFHAGRYVEALAWFDRAVAADRDDASARYYRGIARARTDDFAGAADDLRTALARDPSLYQGALELGVVLVQLNEYEEAARWLARAQEIADLEGPASLFLGLAQFRLDQIPAARVNLDRAARDPKLAVAARYYLGLIAYQQGDWHAAEEHFAYVLAHGPDSDMAREASAFLDRVRAVERPFRLYGETALQYDSNVTLAPSDDDAIEDSVSDEADGRVAFLAGGTYLPWRGRLGQLAVGYEFFQSVQFRLSEFNLQGHRPSALLTVPAGPLRLQLLGRYDYYLLETDRFLQEGTVLPWAEVGEGSFGRTEVFYRMRRRDYQQQRFDELNGFNHATGLRQLVYLGSPDRYVSLGYRFDFEYRIPSEGKEFQYDGQEVNAGLQWLLPAAVVTELGYAYRYELYASESNPGGDPRHDGKHRVGVLAARRLTDYLSLNLGYFGTFNTSNESQFRYDQHIVSLAAQVNY